MNFFGHAAVAVAHFGTREPSPSPDALARLCLGAMLPDFVGMLRLPPRPVLHDPVLARGVAFHHATDEAFHDLPAFLSLSRAAFGFLTERELPRGPARAVAHIGVEMLLDEILSNDAAARDAYRAALAVDVAGRIEVSTPDAPDAQERLSRLQQALLERSRMPRVPEPELMAERIGRALAGRPRLATNADGERTVASWVRSTRPLVAVAAPGLLAELRARLARFGGAE
jgi:hypothetical protein